MLNTIRHELPTRGFESKKVVILMLHNFKNTSSYTQVLRHSETTNLPANQISHAWPQ